MQRLKQIVWQDKYRIGIDTIDRQHVYLLELLNRHRAEHQANSPIAEQLLILADFNTYATMHFAVEAAEVEQAGLSDTDLWQMHEGEHDYYQQRMLEFQRQAEQQDQTTSEHLLSFVQYWWLNHILQADQALGLAIKNALNPTKDPQ